MKLKSGHELATESPTMKTLTLCKWDGTKLFRWLVALGIHHEISWDNDDNMMFEVARKTP